MVERGGLENRCGCKPTQGSNPCLSATKTLQVVSGSFMHPSPLGALDQFQSNLVRSIQVTVIRFAGSWFAHLETFDTKVAKRRAQLSDDFQSMRDHPWPFGGKTL